MKRIFESITEFFKTENLTVHRIGNDEAYSMTFKGQHGEWVCSAQAFEDDRTFVFYSACPVKASPQNYPAVAELLNRLNYGMLCGSFELGYFDGDIRLRTAIEVPDHDLEHLMIDRVVYNNIATMDMYLPAILSVVERGMAPLDAISDALLT